VVVSQRLLGVGEGAFVLRDRLAELSGRQIGDGEFAPGQDRVGVSRPLQAFLVRHDALVQGERILRLFRSAVRGGQAGPGADRIGVIRASHAFPVGERALAEGDGFLEPPGLPAGVSETAAGGYGLRVIGPEHALHPG